MKIFLRRGIWHVRFYRHGREVKRSLRTKSEKQARRNADAIMAEVSRGRFAPEHDRIDYQQMEDALLRDYRLNERRSMGDLATVRFKHLRWFRDYQAKHITTDLISRYINHRLDEKAANASINRELAALKRMFNVLGMQPPRIKMLRENNARQGFVEWADFQAIRERLPEPINRLVTVCYVTGWRFSAVANLEWRDVGLDRPFSPHREHGVIRLRKEWSKNNTAVEFPLTDILSEAIYGRSGTDIGLGLTPYVFANPRTLRPYKDIRDSWKRACKAAGWDGLLIHDLCRSAIRNMVRTPGVTEHMAMALSGRKTRHILDRYDIVSSDDRQKAAEALQAYLDDAPKESKVRRIKP